MAQENVWESIIGDLIQGKSKTESLSWGKEVNLVSKALRSISACFAHFYRRVPIRYCRHDCARPDLSCFRNEYAVSTCSFTEYSLQESSVSCKWSLLPTACTIMSHCTEETRREAVICLRLNRKQVRDPGLENSVCVIATGFHLSAEERQWENPRNSQNVTGK